MHMYLMKTIPKPSIRKNPDTSMPHPVPTSIPAPGIGHRIGLTAGLLGTRRYASNVACISSAALQRYIKEENAPTFDAAARLCAAADVRLDWLATGEGPMEISDTSASSMDGEFSSSHPDETRLTEALATIDQALNMTQRRTTPQVRARLTVMAYRLLAEEASTATILSQIMQAVDAATSADGA